MADAMIIERPRVDWSAVVAGAFVATAIATVLGLFGSAFGKAGIVVLSGVWEILTPLVAGFVGAVVAAALANRAAYLQGVLVWALSIAFAGALMAVTAGSMRAGAAQNGAAGPSGTVIALGGLAAILGLVGALIGAAIGNTLEGRRSRGVEERTVAGREYAHTTGAETARPVARPGAEPPELRH